jgi:hypothetical protein
VAKLSRAIIFDRSCEVRQTFRRDVGRESISKVATFYYAGKKLSTGTQICDYFEMDVYIQPESLGVEFRSSRSDFDSMEAYFHAKAQRRKAL